MQTQAGGEQMTSLWWIDMTLLNMVMIFDCSLFLCRRRNVLCSLISLFSNFIVPFLSYIIKLITDLFIYLFYFIFFCNFQREMITLCNRRF